MTKINFGARTIEELYELAEKDPLQAIIDVHPYIAGNPIETNNALTALFQSMNDRSIWEKYLKETLVQTDGENIILLAIETGAAQGISGQCIDLAIDNYWPNLSPLFMSSAIIEAMLLKEEPGYYERFFKIASSLMEGKFAENPQSHKLATIVFSAVSSRPKARKHQARELFDYIGKSSLTDYEFASVSFNYAVKSMAAFRETLANFQKFPHRSRALIDLIELVDETTYPKGVDIRENPDYAATVVGSLAHFMQGNINLGRRAAKHKPQAALEFYDSAIECINQAFLLSGRVIMDKGDLYVDSILRMNKNGHVDHAFEMLRKFKDDSYDRQNPRHNYAAASALHGYGLYESAYGHILTALRLSDGKNSAYRQLKSSIVARLPKPI
jgi:tetratricopeptide (TPR) repeat protein